MADFDKISELLQKGKAKDVEALVKEAVDAGTPPGDILEKGLIAGMAIILSPPIAAIRPRSWME